MVLMTMLQEGTAWDIAWVLGFNHCVSCVSHSLTQEVLQVLSVLISLFSKDGDLQSFLSL